MPKLEIRNSNDESNPNDQNSKRNSDRFGDWFVIRVSNLIRHYRLKPRPLAVDAFRLCRFSVNNVCKRN